MAEDFAFFRPRPRTCKDQTDPRNFDDLCAPTRGSSLANFSKRTATWNFAFLVNSTVGIMRKGCIWLKGSLRCATLRFISTRRRIPFSFFFVACFFYCPCTISFLSLLFLEYSCCTLSFKGLTMIDNLRGLCSDNLIRQTNWAILMENVDALLFLQPDAKN